MTRHWLLDRFAAFSHRDAIVSRDRTMTYAQLGADIAEWLGILERKDLSAGSVVAIRGDYSPTVCALFLAAVLHRRIVVALPPGEDAQRHLDAAHADALFDFADPERWSDSARSPGSSPPPVLTRLRDRNVGGLVVFTSGTTSAGKAALFDFDALAAPYLKARPGYRTLVFLRLDHLGGIHTMLHTLAHGGTLVISEDRRPDAVAGTIERQRIELLPTTPTFLRMLMISGARARHDLSSLRLITYGTEPMPASTLESLGRAFPGVCLKQTYGLTELGVLPTRSRGDGSLWLELGGKGCEARVVEGVLWLRSETAMLGYLNAPSPFDQDGWYNTQDAVEVDGPYIRVLGRTTELINVGGQKVYPSEVESALLELDNVREVTVWGEASPVTGQVVAARVTLVRAEDLSSLERRIHEFFRGRLEPYKIPAIVEIVDGAHHGERFKKVRPRANGAATARPEPA